jgi:Undecaprenyl-phosphate glucose phosphotransferase
MLRRHHRFFQSVLVGRDAAVAGLAFCLAYLCRFSLPDLLPFHTLASPSETAVICTMLVMIWPVVGYWSGLYASQRARSALHEWVDVLRVTLVSLVLLVSVAYFIREVRYSRAILLLWAVFCPLLQGVVRQGSRLLLYRLRSRGYNLRHLMLVGAGELAERVRASLEAQSHLGMRIVCQLQMDEAPPTAAGAAAVELQLTRLLAAHRIDQVILALPIDRLGSLRGLVDRLSHETVDVRLVPDFYQFMTLCGSIDELGGLPIITLQGTPLFGANRLLKRLFDVSMAGLGLLLLSPLLLLIASFIRLSGPGPILFRQRRVGMDGQEFDILKFRTMVADAERAGARMATPGDPRCTPLGACLRRFSLDELPQLWNVVAGHMSLVGPRPERPCFIDAFKKKIPRYALRHKIKAGITGWAQIHGMRGNTSIAKRIELDLYYIEHWSLGLDVKILVRTVLGGFISPHAY